jgi:hypothetical protein
MTFQRSERGYLVECRCCSLADRKMSEPHLVFLFLFPWAPPVSRRSPSEGKNYVRVKPKCSLSLYLTVFYHLFSAVISLAFRICSASTLVVRGYAGAGEKVEWPSAYKSSGRVFVKPSSCIFISIQAAYGQAALWALPNLRSTCGYDRIWDPTGVTVEIVGMREREEDEASASGSRAVLWWPRHNKWERERATALGEA